MQASEADMTASARTAPLALSLLAALAPGVALAGDVVRDGTASTGSIRQYANDQVLRPGGQAPEGLRPGQRQVEAVNPSDLRATDYKVDPRSDRYSQAPLRTSEGEAPAGVRPSEAPAERALRPGEVRTRERSERSRLQRGVAVAEPWAVAEPVRSSAASAGGRIASPSPDWSRSAGASMSFTPGWVGSPTVEGPRSEWYQRRSFTRMVFEGWACRPKRYVEVGEETLRYCQGVWVRKLIWGGEAAYLPVSPPPGATVPEMPEGYQKVVHAGRTYYYAAGTFYERSPAGFAVVRPPAGAWVGALPKAALEVEVDGRPAQLFDAVLFRASGSGWVVDRILT
jgi:hypothetical protein